jgi:hypothetical protein
MAKCEICEKGPFSTPSTPLFRINEKGVDGIFRCRKHLPEDYELDPIVEEITTIVATNPPPPLA